MTWPVPTGKRKGWPPARELSNCLPLLSFAAASYSQPVYCTTATFPAVTGSPPPALVSVDCGGGPPLGGPADGVPPPGAVKTRGTAGPHVDRGPVHGRATVCTGVHAAVRLH